MPCKDSAILQGNLGRRGALCYNAPEPRRLRGLGWGEQQEMNGRWLAWATALALLAGAMAGAVAGATAALLLAGDEGGDARGAPTYSGGAAAWLDTSRVVARALPAVVTIVAEQQASRDPFGRVVQQVSLGSGVIIDRRGYIVTNEHVIRGAQKLIVRLYSGEERPAVVVGHDRPFTDIAVIKIAEGSLTALPLADSDTVVPGQPVVAIGHSLRDFAGSVTVGVVSGVHRRWLREGVMMEDVIQTDAAVNHGNSGGAIVNAAGELVGLTTQVVRRTEEGQAVEGIALALSSNTVARVAWEIVKAGSVARPYLGVAFQNITPELAEEYGLPVPYGALVTQVVAGSPAAAALQQGDIILGLDGIRIDADMPFINVLSRLAPNRRVSVVVQRGRQELTLEVPLALRGRSVPADQA